MRGIQVCLIRKGNNPWSIPKGLIEHGDTQRATAVREAWEEAGIRGRLVGRSIGRYQYDKWGDTLTVAVYLMKVRSSQRRWPESDVRRRQWMAPARASAALRRHPARAAPEADAGATEGERGRVSFSSCQTIGGMPIAGTETYPDPVSSRAGGALARLHVHHPQQHGADDEERDHREDRVAARPGIAR